MKETQTQDGFKSFKGFSNSSKRLTCFNIAIALIFVLLLVPQVFAILPNGNVKIFAVTDDHKGMSADLFIYTIPGTGRAAFITSSSLVGKDTQTTGNIALQIAEKLTREKLTDKDIVFDIRANATEVDGPSAGAAMTLLTYSMYSEKPIPEGVAITGTINNDGSVGMVGGVGPKAQAAAKTGIKLFMIPTGEAVTELDDDGKFETVNLLEYGPRKLGIKVVEVSTITQAIEYAYMNFDDIIVDSNIALQTFIPAPIKYDDILLPMRKISETYISNATTNVDNAKKALDQSTLVESELADYYVKYGATRRGVEMSKRFLDQNYLYSAANYAFSSSVMAITINEIALNPTLLSENSNLLSSKISVLEAEINLVKQKSEFFSMDRFEWIIGAQQRLAYAKNAIDKINNTQLVTVDVPADSSSSSKDAQKQLLFDKVYEYASAKAWVGIAKE
ncbi:MAG: hypothetical protein NTY48_07335, partial [Candidatus Diapherotrites archaeon]|nr:hypothetical protein [Candidatus Diapherotrites archaeon]